VARRLLIAVLLVAGVWFVCDAVLPRFGLSLPPIVPALVSLVMLVATLLVEADKGEEEDDEDDDPDPIGLDRS